MFLYHSGDQRVKPYFDRVLSNRAAGFVSEVNLAEFYYKTIDKLGMQTAETWYMQVRQSHLRPVAPDEVITRRAAVWKSKTKNLSLADCFALATTEAKAQVLITTDPVLAKVKEIKTVHISKLDRSFACSVNYSSAHEGCMGNEVLRLHGFFLYQTFDYGERCALE